MFLSSSDPKNMENHNLDRYKKRVEQLYIKENKSLKEIMEILKQEGCNASRNMYTKKIRTWRLAKYKKPDNMVELVERINAINPGQNQTFKYGCKTISPSSIARYSERREQPTKGKSRRRIDLEFRLVQVPSQPDILDGAQQFLRALCNAQKCFVSIQLAENIYGQPKKIFLTQFNPDIMSGIQLFGEGRTKPGAAFFERAFRKADIALKEDPYLLPRLCFHVLYMINEKLPDLAEVYTRYLFQVSTKVLGTNHYLTIFIQLLHQQRHNKDLIFNGMHLLCNTMNEVAGISNPMTLHAKKQRLFSRQIAKASFEEMCHHHEDLIKQHKKNGIELDILDAKRNYAVYLLMQKKFSSSRELYRELTAILVQEPLSENKSILALGLQSLSELAATFMEEHLRVKVDDISYSRAYIQAETLQKSAIEKSILLLGPKHHLTLMLCEWFARFHKDFGSPAQFQFHSDFVLEQLEEFTLG